MALTVEQLADLRADLGDSDSAVSDERLNRNWERVVAASTELVRHDATLALTFRQLLAEANKLHDWKAGAVDHKMSQVRKNLEDMFNLYKPALDQIGLVDDPGLVITKLKSRPVERRTPYEE